MKLLTRPPPLDRYTQIGDLAVSVSWVVQRALLPSALVLAAETGYLYLNGSHGATAFACIAAGTMLLLGLWRSHGIGLPMMPVVAVQNLIIYGLPIVIGHEVVGDYPESFVTQAGIEVLVFSVCLALAWRLGLLLFHPASARCHALQGFKQEGTARLRRIGFGLVIGTSLYQLVDSLQLTETLYNFLPEGSNSIIVTLLAATGTCGFFLTAMFVGNGTVSPLGRLVFWVLLAVNCFISASGFLLSTTSALLGSVLIGLFWSSGRMPWRYLVVVVAALAFLNLGKFTMRDRYWTVDGDQAPQFSLGEMPGHYAEWIQASYDAIAPGQPADDRPGDRGPHAKSQSLLERINNLQNLLYVIDAVEAGHIAPLHGATYWLIPPLFIPRVLWPNKPRTHEGQIMLNVHFGRQELESTQQTYVAWGLLPEAYGNFGAIYGAILLGGFLGVLFAGLECWTARKLLISLEGFISFTLLLGMMGSFEMVASVLVTSIFQSVVVLVAASLPFVQSTVLLRPAPKPPAPS